MSIIRNSLNCTCSCRFRGVPWLDQLSRCRWMHRHWGSFPSFNCLTKVVLWCSTFSPFNVPLASIFVQLSHTTSRTDSDEMKWWRQWSRVNGWPHVAAGILSERLSKVSNRTGLWCSQCLQTILLVSLPWKGCWDFQWLDVGWGDPLVRQVICLGVISDCCSRECTSNKCVTRGWRSRSSSNDEVMTWNNSWASCSSNDEICHLYILKTSNKQLASKTSSSVTSWQDKAGNKIGTVSGKF